MIKWQEAWDSIKRCFAPKGVPSKDILVVYVRYEGQYLFFKDRRDHQYWPILIPVEGIGDLNEDRRSINRLFVKHFRSPDKGKALL